MQLPKHDKLEFWLHLSTVQCSYYSFSISSSSSITDLPLFHYSVTFLLFYNTLLFIIDPRLSVTLIDDADTSIPPTNEYVMPLLFKILASFSRTMSSFLLTETTSYTRVAVASGKFG